MNPKERPGVMAVDGGGLDMFLKAADGALRREGGRVRELGSYSSANGTLTPRAYQDADHVQRSRAPAPYLCGSQPGPQLQTQDLPGAIWGCSLYDRQRSDNGRGSDAGGLGAKSRLATQSRRVEEGRKGKEGCASRCTQVASTLKPRRGPGSGERRRRAVLAVLTMMSLFGWSRRGTCQP